MNPIALRERISQEYIAGESRSVLMYRYEVPWWRVCKICNGLLQEKKSKNLTTLQIDTLLSWPAIHRISKC